MRSFIADDRIRVNEPVTQTLQQTNVAAQVVGRRQQPLGVIGNRNATADIVDAVVRQRNRAEQHNPSGRPSLRTIPIMPDVDAPARATVSAVILVRNRKDAVRIVLDKLAALARDDTVDEIVVVDSGSTDGTPDVIRAHPSDVHLIEAGTNVAIAGRNIGVRAATGDYVLILDDDCYPLPGAVSTLRAFLDNHPQVGLVGGLVRDVDPDGDVIRQEQPGTFDWWLRGGRRPQPAPADGWPCFFFPEGACLARRDAFLDVGGFFEPYFFGSSEVDVTTRLLAAGWDVRYQPAAAFDHMKAEAGRTDGSLARRMRVRNQIWYFSMHFPWPMAVRRIPAYLAWDFVECAWHGAIRTGWLGGIAAAWRQRAAIRGARKPLPRNVLKRAELNRGRLHMRLLVLQLGLKSRALKKQP